MTYSSAAVAYYVRQPGIVFSLVRFIWRFVKIFSNRLPQQRDRSVPFLKQAWRLS